MGEKPMLPSSSSRNILSSCFGINRTSLVDDDGTSLVRFVCMDRTRAPRVPSRRRPQMKTKLCWGGQLHRWVFWIFLHVPLHCRFTAACQWSSLALRRVYTRAERPGPARARSSPGFRSYQLPTAHTYGGESGHLPGRKTRTGFTPLDWIAQPFFTHWRRM